jgi:hypothetical protein
VSFHSRTLTVERMRQGAVEQFSLRPDQTPMEFAMVLMSLSNPNTQ